MIRLPELTKPLGRVRGIYYGWWMSGIAAICMALGSVPLFQSMPVWNPVLRGHFGWTPDQMQWAFALTKIEGGLLGPLEGFLVDRLGPRRMLQIGLTILGVGFLLFSQVNHLWQLYLAFLVMSLGTGLGIWIPMMTVMNNWFIRSRSTAMAWAFEGYAVGGFLLVPVIAWAIGGIDQDQPDRFGWRATAAGIGAFILLVSVPISRMVRSRPEDYGLYPDGRPPAPAATSGEEKASSGSPGELEYTWQQAVRTRTFWLISVGHACAAAVFATIAVHLGFMLDDQGLSLQTIGLVVSTYIAIGAAFILVGGHIGDRVPIRMAIFGFALIQSVAVIVLLLAGESLQFMFLFAVLFGIGFGGRAPLTTAIRGAYFGRRAFARITGMSMVPMSVLTLIFPVFAGYMYRFSGGYGIAFTVLAIVGLMGSFLFLLLGEPNPTPSLNRATGEGNR